MLWFLVIGALVLALVVVAWLRDRRQHQAAAYGGGATDGRTRSQTHGDPVVDGMGQTGGMSGGGS